MLAFGAAAEIASSCVVPLAAAMRAEPIVSGLLTGEAFNEESREEAGRLATSVENVREVINELRVAPTSSLGNRANDSYISSKVKARFVDQKDFHVQQVKVVTEAGTTYLMGLVTECEGSAATEIAGSTARS